MTVSQRSDSARAATSRQLARGRSAQLVSVHGFAANAGELDYATPGRRQDGAQTGGAQPGRPSAAGTPVATRRAVPVQAHHIAAAALRADGPPRTLLHIRKTTFAIRLARRERRATLKQIGSACLSTVMGGNDPTEASTSAGLRARLGPVGSAREPTGPPSRWTFNPHPADNRLAHRSQQRPPAGVPSAYGWLAR